MLNPIRRSRLCFLQDPLSLNQHLHEFLVFFIRDIEDHGYLVEGILTTSKKDAVSKSIPYKYVIYRYKKLKYEYEYIYKMESSRHPTNRCLFVKDHLITDDGKYNLCSFNMTFSYFSVCIVGSYVSLVLSLLKRTGISMMTSSVLSHQKVSWQK